MCTEIIYSLNLFPSRAEKQTKQEAACVQLVVCLFGTLEWAPSDPRERECTDMNE